MSYEPAPQQYHEANRQSWNAATAAHNTHKHDQAGFLRAGGSTLFPEEVELLGDVRGRRLVHLQCNAGQDSLSIALLGADVTGVDISDTAIEFAQQLARDSGIAATFERADVYDWLDGAFAAGVSFDVAFCSYGALCWLSDLRRWARLVAGILAPGGRFVAVEFHPAAMMFDERFRLHYSYFGAGTPIVGPDGIRDYVALAEGALSPSGHVAGAADFRNPHPNYEFQWHLGAIFEALLAAGLRIEHFCEYPYSNGAKLFDGMRESDGRRMYPPAHLPELPLMYSIVARQAMR